MASSHTTERLEIRLNRQTKERIARAADLVGLNLTAFTVSTLQARVDKILEEHTEIALSGADRQRFLALLDDPPTANAALRRAARRHGKQVAR